MSSYTERPGVDICKPIGTSNDTPLQKVTIKKESLLDFSEIASSWRSGDGTSRGIVLRSLLSEMDFDLIVKNGLIVRLYNFASILVLFGVLQTRYS